MSDKVDEYVLKNTKDSLQLIYLIYGAGALTMGFTTVLGAIWAYLERENTDAVLRSHITFLLHTFWKGLLFLFVGGFFSFFVLGFLILIFWFVWLIIRCVNGFKALKEDKPIEDPKRWWF